MNAYYFQWNESMVGERLKCLRMGTADWYPFTGYEKSGEGGVFPAIFSITLVKQLVTALYWQFKKILERFKFAKKISNDSPTATPPPRHSDFTYTIVHFLLTQLYIWQFNLIVWLL